MRRQQGVALAMLLWIVAALTLLVSGVVALSRTDVQLTSLQLGQAQASAAAQGAAHLLMRDLMVAREAGDYDGRGILTRRYRLDDIEILGRAYPVSGLVSLNSASAELLTDLLRYTGGQSQTDAEDLAERVVQWRGGEALTDESGQMTEEARDNGGQGNRVFAVPEDLLKVSGVSRALYDRISPALHSNLGGQSRVNPAAAPRPVLLALSQGDEARVDFIEDSRQDVPPGETADYSGLPASHLSEDSGASAYCLEIEVTVSKNRVFQQRIWVDAQSNESGVPWRITRMQPATVQPREAR